MFIYALLGIQNEDFLNIDLTKGKDIRFFVDPFVIANCTSPIGMQIRTKLFEYFNHIMDLLSEDSFVATDLGPLSEVKEAKLGYGTHHGAGCKDLALDLYNQIRNSQSRQSGLLTDLLDINIFVRNIGSDRTSDWMLNIVFNLLQTYTRDKLSHYAYPFEFRNVKKEFYNDETNVWSKEFYSLPFFEDVPFILVPKSIASYNGIVVKGINDFVDHGILTYVIDHIQLFDELQDLIKTYKSGTRKGQPRPITKKDIREYFNLHGRNLSNFSNILWLNERIPGLIDAAKVVYYRFRMNSTT